MTRFRKVKEAVVATAVALVVAGVVTGVVAQSVEPPEIVYGETRCSNAPCQMIIKDPEHAASLVTSDGNFAFCDIGCLLVFLKTRYPDGEKVLAAFVRDWPSQEWIEARTAVYVRTDIRTPMRYGLIAFKDSHAAAEYVAQHGGEVLGLKEATHYVMTERARRMGGSGGGHDA